MAQSVARVAVSPTLDRAVRRLQLYARKLASWPVLWVEIGHALADAEREWFQTQGDGSWAPLDPDYAARKAALFPGKTILRATDELYKSLTDPARAMTLAGPDTLLFGSDVTVGNYKLGALHQEGAGHLPVRKPLVSIVKQREIVRIATDRHVRYSPRSV